MRIVLKLANGNSSEAVAPTNKRDSFDQARISGSIHVLPLKAGRAWWATHVASSDPVPPCRLI
jgi:hypothetical protein